MNAFQKFHFILLEFPLNIIRDITIPACEVVNWKRLFFILMPLTSTVFVVLATKSIFTYKAGWEIFFENYIILLSTVFLILVMMIAFTYTTYRNRVPDQLIVLNQ
jgi:hypothetical protein